MLVLPDKQRMIQPSGTVAINDTFRRYVAYATYFSVSASSGFDASQSNALSPLQKTGTTTDFVPTPYGLGVKGDGSSGLYSRAVSISSQPMWMMASFVANAVSTAGKVNYGLGSSATSLGAFCGINNGDGTVSNIVGQFRGANSSSVIGKKGPTPVVGNTYNAVFVCPDNTLNSAYIYVNGIKYTASTSGASDITFTTTLVNESVCALKRGTTASYSSDTILCVARGFSIPESIAQSLSVNPWQLFQPDRRTVYFDFNHATLRVPFVKSDGNTDNIKCATDGSVRFNNAAGYYDPIYSYTWFQRGSVLEASDAADNDYFASSVALSDDGAVLAVGAPSWEGSTGTNRGGVYIYDWSGSAWYLRGSVLEASDAANSDTFGASVALSDDGAILAVGVPNWEGSTGTNRGGVYIYDWSGSAWIQRGSVIEASDAADNDYFGTSVALSDDGSVLAVGAVDWEGSTGSDRGGVYIYDWSGSAWSQRGSVIEASDAANADRFGQSVALSSDGSVLAVGARAWEGSTGSDRGGVYIYDWSGSAWSQRGSVLEASDAADNDDFGTSVSLSDDGTVLAIGARAWEGSTGSDRGGVYIYDWSGSAWVQRGSVLSASDAASGDNFGAAVALSSNGSILVIGASDWEGSTGTNRGGVYIYDEATA